MGGDNSPDATLNGAYLASKELGKDETIVLVGDEGLAKSWFMTNNLDYSIFEFIHADQVISMNEHATKSLRKNPITVFQWVSMHLKIKKLKCFLVQVILEQC